MSANIFGNILKAMTFGESHGVALGCIIDGCPSGVTFSEELLIYELERRRPGVHGINQTQGVGISLRQEEDRPEILSGVFFDSEELVKKTLGTPIAIMVKNHDAKSQDYKDIKKEPRRGHADDVWRNKFGLADHRGGGRSSGRETLARVMVGSVSWMILSHLAPQLEISAFISELGPFKISPDDENDFLNQDSLSNKNLSYHIENKIIHKIDKYLARVPFNSSDDTERLKQALLKAQSEGESYGASIKIVVRGVPKNLGQPVFHKLKSDLAQALLSIGAVTDFQLGDSRWSRAGTEFHGIQELGENKQFSSYGGIRGGISTGDEILIHLSIKPTSSIRNVAQKGRHDPCIGIRAIPVIESMVAWVLADHLLWTRLDRI